MTLFALAIVCVGAVVAIVVAVAIYATASSNAVAGMEDVVVSVVRAGDAPVDFMRALGGAVNGHVHGGNAVVLFQNGVEIFPAMLAAIAAARSNVHFATFIYWAGIMPETFADAFAAAARRGVVVRVALDSSGASKIPAALITHMRSAGCHVHWFRPARWFSVVSYNHRSHRRLLVIDGREGFTGGVGIADEWTGNGDSPNHWRDTQIRVRGPAVASLQAAFVDTWNNCSRQLPLDASCFPAIARVGTSDVCIVQSNPAEGTSAARRSVSALIAGAGRSLAISNAYFVPTPTFSHALVAARKRGVDIKVLMPGPYHDEPPVRRASRHTWKRLMEAGVELFEDQRAMMHAKVIVVDECVTAVGSINFDPRSFALNAECAAVTSDPAVAAEALRAFAADVSRARRVTAADVASLGPTTRILDRLCYLVRAQL